MHSSNQPSSDGNKKSNALGVALASILLAGLLVGIVPQAAASAHFGIEAVTFSSGGDEVDVAANYSVEFHLNHTVPDGGNISLVFPAGFDATLANATATEIAGGPAFQNATIIDGVTVNVTLGANSLDPGTYNFTVVDVQTPATGGNYTDFTLTTANATNDVIQTTIGGFAIIQPAPAFSADPSSITIEETGTGNTTTVTINLTRAPLANTTVVLDVTGTADVLVPSSVNFSAGETSKAIVLEAVNNNIDHVTNKTGDVTLALNTSATNDTRYTDAAPSSIDIGYTIGDDDVAALSAPAALALDEGDSTSVTFSLVTTPESDVVVDVVVETGLTLDTGATLTFTGGVAPVAKTVNITATDNGAVGGDILANLTFTVNNASSADAFDGLVKTVGVSIADDEEIGVEVSPTVIEVAEQDETSDSYEVRLKSQPTASVTITPAYTGNDFDFSPATLTFTTSNWDTEQEVTVTANDDGTIETSSQNDGTITHSATSTDTDYNGLAGIPSVTVEVQDNDAPGITFVGESGLTVTEGGSAVTYQVKINTQPSATVTIDLSTASEDITVTPETLTWTQNQWPQSRTVTVRAVNDDLPELDETALIIHDPSSTDTGYNGLSNKNVAVLVKSNDNGVIVLDADDLEVMEGSDAYDEFQVQLARAPTADVTVSFNGGEQVLLARGTSTPTQEVSVTFTPTNWLTAKTVRVFGVDDTDVEGDHTGVITIETTSTQSAYDDLDTPDVVVVVKDNGDGITDADVKDANNKITVTVTRDGNDNLIRWTLPSGADLPGQIQGVQVWYHNSPYSAAASYDKDEPEFTTRLHTHVGAEAKATTAYLVTMWFEGDVGKFTGTDAPDSDDYPGTAADSEDGVTGNWWFWLLIVVGALIVALVVVLVIIVIRRNQARGTDDGGDDWDDDDDLGWDDDVVEAAPEPIAAPVESGQVHNIHCPRCSHDFAAHGDKPLVTNCPNCSARGILR